MDPDFMHAINGDWDSLLAAMRESRSLVHRTDSTGMSILHWVCLHQDVPTDVVIKVVFANPHAVQLRNDAGHLPMDLAIQAEGSERVLEILRAAYTSGQEDEEPAVEVDLGQSYFRGMNNNTRPQFQFQQQQRQPQFVQQQHQPLQSPQSNYHYRQHDQQQRNNNNNYRMDEPPHQQMVMYGRNNSYRDYPEDEDDDDRYSGRALHAPPPLHAPGTRSRGMSAPKFPKANPDAKAMYSIYSNQTGAERDDRERGRSHSSSTSVFSAMVLTEQRLQQREHDLISQATEDHHDDQIFDPSLGRADLNRMLKPAPVAESEWDKPRNDSGGNGDGSATNGKKPRAQSIFPPRWKQSRNCHVCMTHFTMVKRRHHCRNCGQSVCGGHSTNRVALPKFGLMDPQRICDKCFLSGHHMASVLPVGSGSFGIGSITSHTSSIQQKQPAYAGR
ncbi:Mitochondrial distribution/morphology family 35/apoptosis [Globisporangium polare]